MQASLKRKRKQGKKKPKKTPSVHACLIEEEMT